MENKINSLIWLGFEGKTLPSHIIKLLQTGSLGGIILFSRNLGNPREIIELTNEIQHLWSGKTPLPIGIDQEGGRVRRLSFVKWPAVFELGKTQNPNFIAKIAEGMGKELDLLGFNINFAPVLDVWSNPLNNIIGNRAFGTTAQEVINNATSFIKGFAKSGVLNCGKHFPGHGDTLEDSHKQLPILNFSYEKLSTHLKPFIELAPMLDSIMVAHILYTQIDDIYPATLSSKVMKLTDKLKFNGILISDDLEMGALDNFENIAVQSIESGCDMIMICSSYEKFVEYSGNLTQYYNKNQDFKQLINTKIEKIEKWKTKLKKPTVLSTQNLLQHHYELIEQYNQLINSTIKQ